jgi:hypothetical protein
MSINLVLLVRVWPDARAIAWNETSVDMIVFRLVREEVEGRRKRLGVVYIILRSISLLRWSVIEAEEIVVTVAYRSSIDIRISIAILRTARDCLQIIEAFVAMIVEVDSRSGKD